jgi:clan AA aspartic protease
MPHHESGNVNASLEACVLVKLAGGGAVRCLVDTGFTGALVLPRDFVTSSNLRVVARETFTTVEEHVIEADIAVAEVEWLGETQTRRAIVNETGEALLGTEMLIGTVLMIDYVASSVTVTKQS